MSKHKRPGNLCEGILGGSGFQFFGSIAHGAHFGMRAGAHRPPAFTRQVPSTILWCRQPHSVHTSLPAPAVMAGAEQVPG